MLTVPTEAVVSEGGHDICYVAHEDGLERREVKLGQSNQDLLEITDGLGEGEQVVLNPSRDEAAVEEELRTYPAPPTTPAQESTTVAAVTAPQPESTAPIPAATH